MNWWHILFVAFVGACLFKFRSFRVRFRGASLEESARQKAREKLSGFKKAVEMETSPNEIKISADWFSSIWPPIYAMKPGRWRDQWKKDLIREIDSCYEKIAEGNFAAYLNTPLYQKTELLRFWVKSVQCPKCQKRMHIVYQAYYGGFEGNGLVSLFPVNEKEQTVIFENWFVKDRNQLPAGTHLDHCPNCRTLYSLEKELFTEQHGISPYRFLQDFMLILPDGKRITFAETQPADDAEKGAGK